MENKMKPPKLSSTITTNQALKLCQHFKLYYLVDRINENPEKYKPWKFDGCSGLPDKLLGIFTKCNWEDITYKCCLPHDLGYGYGQKGNTLERERVDKIFYDDLISKALMERWIAKIFYYAVRVLGIEILGLSFSWGFAKKRN